MTDARIDLPPRDFRPAAFPDDFGRRFVLLADAEEEFDWDKPFSRDATATTAIAALPEATRRFVARGVVPAYLVDYPVASDPAAIAILRRMLEEGECEIGAQLHPWVNPPHVEALGTRNSFVGNLPLELERAKIQALTARLKEAFGCPPIAFRAGRYGLGPNSLRLLIEAGYRLDVSVRALFDYSAQGGPDFSRHPVEPWWAADHLLEVPLTATLVGPLRGIGRLPRRRWLRGLLSRARLAGRVALTPEDIPLAEALAAIDVLIDRGHRLFSLSFHTPSLVPGHTPYVRDEADLRRFWAWWDAVFDRFARAGVMPASASEILDAADRARG